MVIATSAGQGLQISYTANTSGEFAPCPREGQAQAKRAKDVRFDAVPLDDKIPADRVVDSLLVPVRAAN